MNKIQKIRLLSLVNELKSHEKIFEEKFEKRNPSEYFVSEGIASSIQSLYTKTEEIFKYIAKVVDNNVPSGEGWHFELLKQMTDETDDRFPVLTDKTYRLLVELKNFRHVVRNNYSANLDYELIVKNGEICISAINLTIDDLIEFIDQAAGTYHKNKLSEPTEMKF